MNKRWLYYGLAVILSLVFLLLGRWQLGRAEWKQDRLDSVAIILKQRKAQSLSALSKRDQTDLAWVAGRGHFLEQPVLLLDNQRRGDRVGVNVYRVFLPDQGRPVLVNLGWLPVPGDRKMPKIEKIVGTYRLDGLLTAPPSPGIAIGPAYVKTRDYWLLTRMPIRQLGVDMKMPLATRVLRLNPDLPIGHERDLDILPNTLPPEKHRAYAVQWFGLCAAMIVLTLVMGFRKKRKNNE